MARQRRNNKIVYKATNLLNNKCYIGWCVDFKERKARHLKAAENGKDTHFYNAIRKYGANNFKWEILYSGLDLFDTCKQLERELIGKYNSYYDGYNATLGGDGGDTYAKLSEQRKKEFQQKCSENNARFWKGKEFNVEHKAKLKITRKKQDMSHKCNAVNQLNDYGDMLNKWKSIKEAAENTKISRSNISHSIRTRENGLYYKAGGFFWAYNKN